MLAQGVSPGSTHPKPAKALKGRHILAQGVSPGDTANLNFHRVLKGRQRIENNWFHE